MNDFNKFSINLQKAIKLSLDAAKYYGSSYVGSEHILFGILNVRECHAAKLLEAAGVREKEYRDVFVRTLDKRVKISGFTPRTKSMFDKAYEFAISHDGAGASVSSEYMLLAILVDDESVAVRILRNLLNIIFGGFLSVVPAMFSLVTAVFSLFFLVLLILGIVNAATGRARELPVIGRFRLLR